MPHSFSDVVQLAQAAAQHLADDIAVDLDDRSNVGGIKWWQGYGLGHDLSADIADYLVSVAETIPRRLEEIAWSRQEYEQASNAFDHWFRSQASKTPGQIPDLRRNLPAEVNRDVKLRVMLTSFYVGAASLLDTLAGVAVGVLGLKASMVKADAGLLDLGDFSVGYPHSSQSKKLTRSLLPVGTAGGDLQAKTLQSVRTSVQHAGPTDWWPWADDMRNVRAHQGKRITMHAVPQTDKNTSQVISELSPRQPRLLDSTSWREAGALGDTFLLEDSRITLTGITSSLSAATVGVCDALNRAWLQRRHDPSLIAQPAEQFPTAPDALNFPGYATAPLVLPKNSNLYTHPRTGRRLRAGRLLNPDQST